MSLTNLELIDGKVPNKCFQLVSEWAKLHQAELIEIWDTQKFHPVQPLE